MHDLTDIRINQYRIHSRPDTVHYYRITTIFEIQISADVINHNKIPGEFLYSDAQLVCAVPLHENGASQYSEATP